MNPTTTRIVSNIARGLTQDGGFLHLTVTKADEAFVQKLSYMASMPTLSAHVVEVLEEKTRKGYVLSNKLRTVLKKAQSTQRRENKLNALFPDRKKTH